ncbi:hypothetical protein BVC80_1793g21 [Macleaya cordata]|uniref:Uncharacterized protein n=1 Tax=Macleaya cordata TaxID=56857 RepID=A0A200QPR2_MACCD|nr:hypothetical protein BVC80_1793g21 [Macleaya cordata]
MEALLEKIFVVDLKEQHGLSSQEEMIDKVNWRTEYLSLVNMEDRKWQQKMKELWVGDGERNTKFYHCYANLRR